VITLQVTIGAAATRASTLDLYASTIIVTASGTDYIGGPNVTTANGIKLSSTPLVIQTSSARGMSLKDMYFAGTLNDTVNIAYEPSM
jgi:hypothetical protein